MDFEYIEIEKEIVPYSFDIQLAAEQFTMRVRYNEMHDYFTIDLEKEGKIIVQGEKVCYGTPLFSERYDIDLPPLEILPYDESGTENRVSYDNLGKTVFLMVVNGNE